MSLIHPLFPTQILRCLDLPQIQLRVSHLWTKAVPKILGLEIAKKHFPQNKSLQEIMHHLTRHVYCLTTLQLLSGHAEHGEWFLKPRTDRNLKISIALTKAKSQEPAYLQVLNRNIIDRQGKICTKSRFKKVRQTVKWLIEWSCVHW